MRVGMADAGDIRYRLVNQLLREGAKRGAARFHVACADADGNVELLMQAGFIRYGEERIMSRAGRQAPARRRGPTRRAAARGSGPAQPIDALALHRLYAGRDAAAGRRASRPSASRTGSARARTGGSRDPASRRSCASPTSRPSSRRHQDGGKDGTVLDGFLQVGVAKEDQPHYLKVLARPEADAAALVAVRAGRHRGDASARAATIATTTASSLPCEPTNHRSIGVWRRRASTRSPASRCS